MDMTDFWDSVKMLFLSVILPYGLIALVCFLFLAFGNHWLTIVTGIIVAIVLIAGSTNTGEGQY